MPAWQVLHTAAWFQEGLSLCDLRIGRLKKLVKCPSGNLSLWKYTGTVETEEERLQKAESQLWLKPHRVSVRSMLWEEPH